MKELKQVRLINIFSIFKIASILNACGKDMAQKYDLHHWDNPYFKSVIIVILCLLKNRVYLLYDDNEPVATFQTSVHENSLFFEKLAVNPSCGGKGLGSYCMDLIEKQGKTLGLSKITMDVYDKSQHALDFYINKGYVQIDTKETLKYTDIIMEKSLE